MSAPWANAYVIFCHGCKRAWYDDGVGFGDGECACTCQPGDSHYEDWVIDPPPAIVAHEELMAALGIAG